MEEGEEREVCQRAHRKTFPFWRPTRKSQRNENSFIDGGGGVRGVRNEVGGVSL